MIDQNIISQEPVQPILKLPINKNKLTLYIFAVIAVILATGGGIYFFSKQTNEPITNIVDNQNTVTPIPTEITTQLVDIIPSKIPTPTTKVPVSTPTPKIASLTLKLKTKNNTESISEFVGEILNQKTNTSILKFTGSGSEKVIDKISNGDYRIKIMLGNDLNNYGCGYSNIIEFSIKNGESLIKEIEILPYAGVVYLKSEDYFPLSGANVSLVNETGDKVYYSTTADNFGRVVINTVNVNPHWLKITAFGQTQTIKINNGKCLWSEVVKLPLSVSRSSLRINITSNTSSIRPELVKKYEPMLNNNLVANFNIDAMSRYTFNDSNCTGDHAITFGTDMTQQRNDDGSLSQVIEMINILPGKYYVCAFDPSLGFHMGFKSNWREVELAPGKITEVNLNYPEL